MIENYYTVHQLENFTEVRDDFGGAIQASGVIVGCSGLLRPLNGNEVIASEKLNVLSSHLIYCPIDTPISSTTIVDDTYTVEFVKNPMSMNHHLEVLLKEIK